MCSGTPLEFNTSDSSIKAVDEGYQTEITVSYTSSSLSEEDNGRDLVQADVSVQILSAVVKAYYILNLKTMNVKIINSTMYYDSQKAYLHPAIENICHHQRTKVLSFP